MPYRDKQLRLKKDCVDKHKPRVEIRIELI